MTPEADIEVGQLVGAGKPVGSIYGARILRYSNATLKISLILGSTEKSHFYAYFSRLANTQTLRCFLR